MIKANFSIQGDNIEYVRVVCYLNKITEHNKDKTPKRYLLRPPKIKKKNINEEYTVNIPTYWTYGVVFLIIKNTSFYKAFSIEKEIKLCTYPTGQKERVRLDTSNNVEAWITLEEEVFNYPKQLPSNKQIRSPFFQIPYKKRKGLGQWAVILTAYKSENPTNDPKKLKICNDSIGATTLESFIENIRFNYKNARTNIYGFYFLGIRDLPSNMFNIIIPGFYTHQSLDFDVHYCVESPRYDKDDWMQPYVAEKAVVHVQQEVNCECFVTAGAAIICRDDFPVVEIEAQCVEYPDLSDLVNHRNDMIAHEIVERVFSG